MTGTRYAFAVPVVDANDVADTSSVVGVSLNVL